MVKRPLCQQRGGLDSWAHPSPLVSPGQPQSHPFGFSSAGARVCVCVCVAHISTRVSVSLADLAFASAVYRLQLEDQVEGKTLLPRPPLEAGKAPACYTQGVASVCLSVLVPCSPETTTCHHVGHCCWVHLPGDGLWVKRGRFRGGLDGREQELRPTVTT